MSRYLGDETCTSVDQVIRYLRENYVDRDGVAMPRAIAADICVKGRAQLDKGITIFRSNVEYLGDEALTNSGHQGWHYIPEPADEQE